MYPQMPIFSYFLIIRIFVSSHTILGNEMCGNNYLFEGEAEKYYLGINNIINGFEAYPSYLSTDIENNQISESEFKQCLKKCHGNLKATTISVLDFGAKGDGKTDDSKAFKKAWKRACSLKGGGGATFVVPKNKTYLLKQINFKGPCESSLVVKIFGNIKASGNRSAYKKHLRLWLRFDSVNNLQVEGGGVINGNGNTWWKNSCKTDPRRPCIGAPTALHFYNIKNLIVKDISIEDGQQLQVSIEKSVNVSASNLKVTAPPNSPNTDGIHITRTQNITLSNILIGTGDDCISIESGSYNVQATNITCGPGHGISIGSLGSDNSTDYVSNILVNGAKVSGTTNGLRIKTYQGGHGRAGDIKFQNVEMNNVSNPIIIDQNYCDRDTPCKEQKSAVQVENLVYKNINGTSASKVAINFDCSKNYPCKGIVLQNINLVRESDEDAQGKDAEAVCNNVNYKLVGVVTPHCASKSGETGISDE